MLLSSHTVIKEKKKVLFTDATASKLQLLHLEHSCCSWLPAGPHLLTLTAQAISAQMGMRTPVKESGC